MIHCCRECLFASVNYCWGSYKHYLNSHLKTHTTHEVLRFFTLYYLQSFSLHFFSHLGSSHLHRRSNKITKLQLSHDTFRLWQVNCSSLPKGTVELCDKNSVLVIKNKQHRRKQQKHNIETTYRTRLLPLCTYQRIWKQKPAVVKWLNFNKYH